MKKKLVLIALLMGLSATSCMHAQETEESVFVVKQPKTKKLSSSALKEKIGDGAKELLDQATLLVSQAGDVQRALSARQQKLTEEKHEDAFFKELVTSVSPVTTSLGVMQRHMATVQSTCSRSIERIINNWSPFKKAKKQALHDCFDCVTQAHTDLTRISKNFQRMHSEVSSMQTSDAKSVLTQIKKLASTLQKEEKVIAGLQKKLVDHECLKSS